MRFSTSTASSLASTLPSFRVVLLFGGVLALSESVALATTLFVGAFVSFAAGLAAAATIYRKERATRDDAASPAAAEEPPPLRRAA